jgi:hypothetical protein
LPALFRAVQPLSAPLQLGWANRPSEQDCRKRTRPRFQPPIRPDWILPCSEFRRQSELPLTLVRQACWFVDSCLQSNAPCSAISTAPRSRTAGRASPVVQWPRASGRMRGPAAPRGESAARRGPSCPEPDSAIVPMYTIAAASSLDPAPYGLFALRASTQTRRFNANSKYRRSGRPYPCRSASGSAWWAATFSGIHPRTGRWSTASPQWPKTRGPCATGSGPHGTLGMSRHVATANCFPQSDRRPVGRRRWRGWREGAARSTLTNEEHRWRFLPRAQGLR